MKKGIYWLASYPKSGNTWFRILLATLLHGTNTPLNLDNLNGSMASNRVWINQALGFDSTYLSDDELDQLRPAIYSWYANQDAKINYHKIHDAYTYIDSINPLIPVNGCLGAIYIIRNPLDVAISFAHHSNISIDMMIELMGHPSLAVPIDINRHKQLRQKLLSWSGHVNSWKSASVIEVLFLRYEDMLFSPFETFKKGINFLNIAISDDDLQRAIDSTSFNKLQQQENENGFKEKSRVANRFFRKGIAGDWESTLTSTQIDRLIHDHGETMHEHGYLDQAYRPIRIHSRVD
jgi:hypothetical protein